MPEQTKQQNSDIGQLRPMKTTDRVLVCGMPGSGKTTMAKYLASAIPEGRLLIYDTLRQYRNFPDKCRYIPQHSDSVIEFDNVCKYLCSVKDFVFVIEEADLYMGQYMRFGTWTSELVNVGRNWGIGIIAVTQRIQEINKRFFGRCSHVFFFQCGIQAKQYITDMVGKELCSQIMNLGDWAFIQYSIDAARHNEPMEPQILELSRKPKVVSVSEKERPRTVAEKVALPERNEPIIRGGMAEIPESPTEPKKPNQ